MAQAKKGDTVKVHYTGKLNDGQIFDSSIDREPLEFKVGSGQIIAGFESTVIGMEPGQKQTVTITADQAYGEHREELVQKVDRANMPDDLELEVGMILEACQTDGECVMLTIIEITDNTVTVDANHPLAGQDLTFEIELMEIA